MTPLPIISTSTEWELYRLSTSVLHERINQPGEQKAFTVVSSPRTACPPCVGMESMEYVQTNQQGHHLFRCRREGCHLKDSTFGGILHCNTEYWQDPAGDLRLFRMIPGHSWQWKELYTKRQAIERVAKSMKESRRLERHCVRDRRKIALHILMSPLAIQAIALVNVLAGQIRPGQWMVNRIP